MRNPCRLAVAVAGAMVLVAPGVEAAWLTIDVPEQVAPGWTRIAGRYAPSEGVQPVFRAIARCGSDLAVKVLAGTLQHLAPGAGALWIDVPGSSASPACDVPQVAIEMLVDGDVVASAAVPARASSVSGAPPGLLVPPPVSARPERRVSLKGQKYGSTAFGKRTEAGVEWSLDSRVSIQLNYERTTQAPMMPFDHDDGILTRLRVGF